MHLPYRRLCHPPLKPAEVIYSSPLRVCFIILGSQIPSGVRTCCGEVLHVVPVISGVASFHSSLTPIGNSFQCSLWEAYTHYFLRVGKKTSVRSFYWSPHVFAIFTIDWSGLCNVFLRVGKNSSWFPRSHRLFYPTIRIDNLLFVVFVNRLINPITIRIILKEFNELTNRSFRVR